MKIVSVKWEDAAHSGGGFRDVHQIKQDCHTYIIHTVGYLAEENRQVVKVATDMDDEGSLRDIQSIPRRIVIEIKELK